MTDSLQTTVLTLDPAGHIGADFTGHVMATGLDLIADQHIFKESPDSQVRWLDPTDLSKVLGFITTIFGASPLMRLAAQPPGTAGPEVGSELAVQYAAGGGTFARVFAQARSETQAAKATIINSDGESSFLRLKGNGTTALLQFTLGIVELEFPGASRLTKSLLQATGLGRPAQFVGLIPIGKGFAEGELPVDVWLTEDPGENTFRIRGSAAAAPAAGTKMKVLWLAIG